ncbi:O-antigen ligase family protein [Halobacteroides halobius]|nr:O-antigen ligase family protein [Halobacteroides halobius]
MTGFFEDPNYFGLYINTFMFIFIFVKYKYEHKFNRTDYLILIISILCIVLTHSRAAMISDFIAIFLLFLTLKKNLKIKLATISSFFLIIIIGIIYYSFPDYLNEIFSRYSFSGGSFSERLKLMKIGLNNIVRYPFGVGLGNVQFYYNEFYGKLKLAHNDFLSVFIETGVIGITFYILYFIRIFILSGKYGKILIITLFIHLNTLSCYKYEPIIPIALAILILESKYNYYFKEG